MFKKIISYLLLAGLILGLTLVANAQTIDPLTNQVELANEVYIVKVSIPTPIINNQPAVFSVNPQFDTTKVQNVEYFWDFGDGNRDKGKEVVHNYLEPGNYTLAVETQVTELNGQLRSTTEVESVFVAQKFALLIADRPEVESKIKNLIGLAKDRNISLQLVESYNSQSAFLSEEVLAKKLSEISEIVQKTDTILVWTQTGTGINAITRYLQTTDSNLQNTTIILLTEDIKNLQRIERQYLQLQPREIIVVREPGINIPYLESQNTTDYKKQLLEGGYEFKVIDQRSSEIKPWRILSYSLNFLADRGIPDNILILILLLPVIATVIAFLKQVVGVSTLGLYTPTIITLTFLILGLKFGITVLLFITIVSLLTQKLLKRFHLLYIPKMAIVITIVSLTIFILFSLALVLNLLDAAFISLAIFPTVIMGTLVEKVISANSSNSFVKSLITIIEVLFVSIIAFGIAGGPIDLFFFKFEFTTIRNLISNYPETIIIFVIINTLLGRWTGLRVTEYFQFREVLYNTEE